VSLPPLRPRPSPAPGAAASGGQPAPAPPAPPAPGTATPEGTLDHRLTRLRDRLDAATAGVDLAPRLLAAVDGAARPGRRRTRPRAAGTTLARSLRLLLLATAVALALTAGAAGAAPLLRDRVLVPALEQVTPAPPGGRPAR
jgi:hypothetical protein